MVFFDVFVMFVDVKNKDEVYQFLNYLLCLDVVVYIFDYVFYVNVNKVVMLLVSVEVCENSGIYLFVDVCVKLFILKVQDLKIDCVCICVWIKVKSGK